MARDRSLVQNTARLTMFFGPSNLWMARRQVLWSPGMSASVMQRTGAAGVEIQSLSPCDPVAAAPDPISRHIRPQHNSAASLGRSSADRP
jgi:hypothetical protein